MKLVLHRSVTFWSGLWVMAFLLWAWRDSFHREAILFYRAHAVHSVNGGFSLMHNPGAVSPLGWEYRKSSYPHPDWAAFQPLLFLRGSPNLDPNKDWDAWNRSVGHPSGARDFYLALMEVQPIGFRMLFIPYWLILLAFIPLWAALLLWRTRRRRGSPLDAAQGGNCPV